ncbi:hypothetical protein TorRG33x02_310510 [Trema orientale]|uniref:Uncharacterized protein n=1 Tax=Trema orientale TaxID=63057 RepID=A0A2P5BSJ6_TREOI|nr:hypothetical protein TorRG33x02_310510 [Trema orientale]
MYLFHMLVESGAGECWSKTELASAGREQAGRKRTASQARMNEMNLSSTASSKRERAREIELDNFKQVRAGVDGS